MKDSKAIIKDLLKDERGLTVRDMETVLREEYKISVSHQWVHQLIKEIFSEMEQGQALEEYWNWLKLQAKANKARTTFVAKIINGEIVL